jgi:hypothetical protein
MKNVFAASTNRVVLGAVGKMRKRSKHDLQQLPSFTKKRDAYGTVKSFFLCAWH